MKQTIEYQMALSTKREKLLEAICHNVKYMANLNETNAAELRLNRDTLQKTLAHNAQLVKENTYFKTENGVLQKDRAVLEAKRDEI